MRNLLMTPGPTPVPEEARFVMAKEMIHHRTEEFSEVMKELNLNLKKIFKTINPVITLSSSGTGAMEASVVNLLSKGDKVVVLNTGNFGKRFVQLCTTYEIEVIEIAYEWGETIKNTDLEKVLSENSDIKAVFVTHHETSTGVLNDVESISKIVKGKDESILMVVDAISGMVANEFKTDEWNIDCVVSGSQKGFMAPPGLAFAALSSKAQEALKKSNIPKFYFSFEKALAEINEGQTPFTPAVSTVLSTNIACRLLMQEGLENVTLRHKRMKEASSEGIKALGLEFFIKEESSRGNTVTTVIAPDGINSGKIKKILAEKYGITIAGGQGSYKGKIFRIGHLGAVDVFDVLITFSALEMTLKELNYDKFKPGDSLAAIQKYLMNNK